MSTHSSIISTGLDHIYEDTSEPVTNFTHFAGWNIYALIDTQTIRSFRFEGPFLRIDLVPNSELAEALGGNLLKFNGESLTYVEYDSDGLSIHIKGDSYLADQFRKQNFAYFTSTTLPITSI